MRTQRELTKREKYIALRVGLMTTKTYRRNERGMWDPVHVMRENNRIRKMIEYRRSHERYKETVEFVKKIREMKYEDVEHETPDNESPVVKFCEFIKKNERLWWGSYADGLVKFVEAELEIEDKSDAEIEKAILAMKM